MNRLIERYEGVILHPYLCPAGIPTIGYGSTSYEDGTKVKLSDPSISLERARMLSERESDRMAMVIASRCKSLSKGNLEALVSFSYNLGLGALFGSTLWRKLLKGDKIGASGEFKKWIYAGGKKLRGLELRREAERVVFNS